MTAAEYEAAIAALGLNKSQAAKFLDISPRTSNRYAAGHVPAAVAMLLWLMVDIRIRPEKVRRPPSA